MRDFRARMATAEPSFGPIAALILRWQQTGEHDALEMLLAAVSPLVKHAAAQTLHRRGIRDTSAIDDALCLVFDHVRRLPSMPDRAGLQAFVPSRSHAGDAGASWICMLARSRAIDIVRMHRRRERHIRCFTAVVDLDEAVLCDEPPAPDDLDVPQLRARLHRAIEQLEPRSRLLVELLLVGKTQAVAAHVLGVCEGTVSRMLTRAIRDLRNLLVAADDPVSRRPPSVDHGETPAPRARAARPGRARVSRRRGPPGPSAPA